MGIPDHLTCLLRNLYAGQEATVRTGHGPKDWFQIWKGVCQDCILSLCLFNLYAEYIRASLVAQMVKHLSAMQETWVQSLGWEDPLEKEMAAHSSILAWKIPWTMEPGRLHGVSKSQKRLRFPFPFQSTSCKILGWMKHKLEPRLLGEISITSDMQITPPLWQKAKKN